jgi:hypothetical protein
MAVLVAGWNTGAAMQEGAGEMMMNAGGAGGAEAGKSFVGPGWYESSWDLHQGLVVREGLPADAHLDEWLEVHLGSGVVALAADA